MNWFLSVCCKFCSDINFTLVALLLPLGFVFLHDSAQASPSTVRLEIGGLGSGSPTSPFDLPLSTALVAGQSYKVLVRAWDNDTDGIAQSVHNFTFNVTIQNGTLNGFTWLVKGQAYPKRPSNVICDPNISYPANDQCDPNDSDFTNNVTGNSVIGYDAISGNPVTVPGTPIDKGSPTGGQVSTDVFAFQSNTFAGYDFPGYVLTTSSKLSLAVVYFTAGATPSQLRLNLDSDPYVSGYRTDNSHYGVDGISYKINQGLGLKFPGPRYHPADANRDGEITPDESINYTIAFKQQAAWSTAPNSTIAPELWPAYWIDSRRLFQQGPRYLPNPNYNCGDPDQIPYNCWVIAP